jgi:hypothetical protein
MFIRKNASKLAVTLALCVASFASFGTAAAAGSADTLKGVAPQLDACVAAATAGDWATAHADYTAFDQAWDSVRDDVLVSSPTAYSAIEDSASTVEDLFGTSGAPVDSAAALTALKNHRDVVAAQAATLA